MEKESIVHDGGLTLRHLQVEDFDNLVAFANDVKIYRNLRDAFPNPYTREDAIAYKEMVEKEQPITSFAIVYQEQCVGSIALVPGTDVYCKSAELGYFIGQPYWNKGFATKAVKLIVEWGFKNLDLNRIHAGVFEHNMASQRVLEKCGFDQEGVFRKAVFKKGEFCDEIRYAICL